jgi:hypothetical protein
MRTMTLRAIKHPSNVDVLLRELVQSRGIVPEGTYEICDRNSLPPVLQRLAEYADHTGHSWACWLDDVGRGWLFIAEMPLPQSRNRGRPVLRVDHFGEDGVIRDTGQWVAGPEGKWECCATD